jgi:hypothetical protein
VNNAWQESIKNTPFMLNFGQQPRTPLNQSGGTEVRVPQASNFAKTLEENLARAKASLLRLGLARSYLLTKDVVKLNSLCVTVGRVSTARMLGMCGNHG